MSVSVRRSYVDSRFGQLHVTTARPTSVVRPSVVCFHHSPHSAEVYRDFLPVLAEDRVVYAPDTPGFGMSDFPPRAPEVADYAAAMLDLIDRTGSGPLDLVGYHTGSLIAIEVALARPQRVRRLFLVCIPVIHDAERRAFEATPWPPPISEDGAHVMTEWQRSVTWRHPKMTTAQIAESFAASCAAAIGRPGVAEPRSATRRPSACRGSRKRCFASIPKTTCTRSPRAPRR